MWSDLFIKFILKTVGIAITVTKKMFEIILKKVKNALKKNIKKTFKKLEKRLKKNIEQKLKKYSKILNLFLRKH